MSSSAYPRWAYYPPRDAAPPWVSAFVGAVAAVEDELSSREVEGLKSDIALAKLRPGLEALGYRVESSKKADGKISLPVLFGEQGAPRVRYEVDAVHDELGVLVEVEAGRGARGNAVYRDLIRTSLIVGARYLALGVMIEYRHQLRGKAQSVASYSEAKDILDAIYASNRLHLPFEGVLLFRY